MCHKCIKLWEFLQFFFFLQSLIFWAKSFLPFKGQTELETRRVFVFNFPLFFSPRTVSLSSYPSIHLALPSKSKSCVTIATAAVCENYLNPSLFSFLLMPCVPSNIRWMLVWWGSKQRSREWKRRRKSEGRGVDVQEEHWKRAAEQKEERRD